ncbi:ELM1/GtrOC1 family putative glycosyltransferase [Geothermobacter hydrogeniphilus]|uniref:Fission protein ELM1 n=1 Tax=Geothermobacter hydrogeniphilus TaxID=1969733 RepID=A0A1X0Y1Q3_9BACT|nr:ELM1/GtrOC1 family putative glycosyltransferase [Geothermobacter hydrogeniphilus]ORJ59046.1 hypothetical protein B5V00_10765 [Geothermobacter hydrogeniphilus]
MKALVLSDGKPGHVNQSLAFAELSGCDHDLIEVRTRGRLAKGLGYLFDRCGVYSSSLFTPVTCDRHYDLVVSAGSETYYANKVLARRLRARSVAIMLPRGFRYDFDLILAQEHDNPPSRDNLVSLPINLCRVSPRGVFRPDPDRRYISLIIGGNSRHCRLDAAALKVRVEEIFALFPAADKLVTTSRRTPDEVERMLETFDFADRVIYSRTPKNPIPDYLAYSDHVFLTGDSTSMVSEAVSFGNGCVEILPVDYRRPDSKIAAMISHLEEQGMVHLFDGTLGHCRAKIDLQQLLKGVL